jgi:hypothetical protein
MDEPLRHRQTKGAGTDMSDLQPPRHISTYMRASLSRVFRWRLAILIAPGYGFRRAVKSRSREAVRQKAQGLRVRLNP